jgi:hypothetical protein
MTDTTFSRPPTIRREGFVSKWNPLVRDRTKPYKSYDLHLGPGPIQDAFRLARLVKKAAYEIYYRHHPRAATFSEYFDGFMGLSHSHVIFLDARRGTSVAGFYWRRACLPRRNARLDERLVIDDDLVTHLVPKKNSSSVSTGGQMLWTRTPFRT